MKIKVTQEDIDNGHINSGDACPIALAMTRRSYYYKNHKGEESILETWKLAEKKVAKIIKGRVTPGSGCGKIEGDVLTKKLYIEVKETTQDHLTLKLDWLYKTKEEAAHTERIPVFCCEFKDGQQRYLVPKEYLEEKNYQYEDIWKKRSTIRLQPEDLPEDLYIQTDYGVWIVVDKYKLKELSED